MDSPRARGPVGARGAATIDLLLRCGAELDARSDAGLTPLDVCLLVERDDVADLLLARGALCGPECEPLATAPGGGER